MRLGYAWWIEGARAVAGGGRWVLQVAVAGVILRHCADVDCIIWQQNNLAEAMLSCIISDDW